MNDLDRALADIQAIRSQLARGLEFRGYGPVTFAITGLLALLAAVLQGVWLDDPATDIAAYLGLWVATAALSAALVGYETLTRSRRVHSVLAEETIVSAIEQFLPATVAGALLAATLLRFAPETAWMLPGLWQIIFGLGIFASSRFLPRPIYLVGAWYVAAGLACLAFARGDAAFSPWAMGVPFAAGQWLVAAILHATNRMQHEQIQ
jgi:hypothetical protein